MTSLREPRDDGPVAADTADLFARYLDWCRESAIATVTALPVDEQRARRLPSGWSPIELLSHLAHMEERWFVWGFLAEPVKQPWGEWREGRWHVPDKVTAGQVATRLRSTGKRTRKVLSSELLYHRAATGGRFDQDPPTLAWICFHVLQEYARHLGHLDVVVELAGVPVAD